MDSSGLADVCTPCTRVTNAASGATYTCTAVDDSRVSGCAPGFFSDSSSEMDRCVECTAVENSLSPVTCISAASSRVAECRPGFTKIFAGDADICRSAPRSCVGSWSAWTACPDVCDNDIEHAQTRVFTVEVPAEDGGDMCEYGAGAVETVPCGDPLPCPIDCDGTWTNWTSCDTDCSNESKIRTYSVSRYPNEHGRACEASDGFVEIQECGSNICYSNVCTGDECPVDCIGEWGAWSHCSKQCTGGTRSSEYTVITHAQYGGREASCEATDGSVRQEQCGTGPCPVDCSGRWLQWNDCSVDCGGGVQTREYLVLTAMANGGETSTCAATNGFVEQRECAAQICEGWVVNESRSPADRRIAVLELTLQVHINHVQATASARVSFEESFVQELALALGVDQSRIAVLKVRTGSTIVRFEILPDDIDTSTPQPAYGMAELRTQLANPDSQLFRGPILGTLDAEAGVTVVSAPLQQEREPSADEKAESPDQDADGCPDSIDAYPSDPVRCLEQPIDDDAADASAYIDDAIDDERDAPPVDCPRSDGSGSALVLLVGVVVGVVIVVSFVGWQVSLRTVSKDAGVADDMVYGEYQEDDDDLGEMDDDLGEMEPVAMNEVPEGVPRSDKTDAAETDPLDGSLV
eukprot:COSAG02_NODE_8443_length_2569_cov_1.576923_1_plen_637_part_00